MMFLGVSKGCINMTVYTSLKTKCDYFPKRNVIFSRLLTQNEM